MKKLLIALALLAGSSSQLEAQTPPATNFPGGVTRPVFVLPTSSVTGGGVTPIPISAPQSCTTPAYTFTGATTSGYGFASSTACIVIGGTQRVGVTSALLTSTVPITLVGPLTFSSAASIIYSDTVVTRQGADYLFQRNSTNAQRQDWANTYTSATNYEAFSVDWQTTANTALVGTRTAATGTTRPLRLVAQASSGGALTYLEVATTGITATTQINTAAGTTAIAPLSVTNGTNLATATANAVENDGTAFYKTQDTTNGRAYLDGWNYFRLTGSGTGITTIADFFGATGSGIPMVANGVYEIEWHAYFSQATAGTATWTVTTATTALANLTGEYMCSNIAGIGTVGAPQTAAINVTASSATAFPVTGTEATAATHYCTIRVIATAGAGASNTRLRLTMGAGTATPLINSYFRVRRLPGGNIGTFVS